MKELAFSVIIPAFNNQHTLSRTFKSLLQQNMSLFEVIVVDDGSKDDTAKIAKDFEKSFNFFHIIKHFSNKGMLEARRTGVNNALGSYILFLDADDEFEPNFLQQLSDFVKHNPDEIITFKASIPGKQEAKDDFLTFINFNLNKRTKLEALYSPIYEERKMSYRVWGRAYLSSYIKPIYNLMPSSYINTSEDAAQTFYLLNSKKASMSFFDRKGYIYHFGEGSSTNDILPLSSFKTKTSSCISAINLIKKCINHKTKDSLSEKELLFYIYAVQKTIVAWIANTWASQLNTLSQYLILPFFGKSIYKQSIYCELLRLIRDKIYEDFASKSSMHFYPLLSNFLFLVKKSNNRTAQFDYYCQAATIHLEEVKIQFLPKTVGTIFHKTAIKKLDKLYLKERNQKSIPNPSECKDREIIPLYLENLEILKQIEKKSNALKGFQSFYFDLYSSLNSINDTQINNKDSGNMHLTIVNSKEEIPYNFYISISEATVLQNKQTIIKVINAYHGHFDSFFI